jgi:moderate conductance mechanosensitive channel
MHVATADECFDDEGSVCRWVYERTDQNEALANLADWFIDTPMRILLIVVMALIVTRITRRWVQRVVAGMVAPKVTPVERLRRLGVDVPAFVQPDQSARKQARAHSVSVLLTSTLVATIWVIAGLLILGAIGVQLGPLLAGAGVAGVALGFGAQTLVRDFIAGLFMMLEDQYGIGDVVDLGEASGVVEDVSLRTTVLRGLDGTVWHVPNGVVERVGNMSQLWSVAVVDVDVAYDADLTAVRGVLLDAANDICNDERYAAQVYEPPEVLGVEALAADGITLRLITRVEPGSQFAIQRAIREHVKERFDAAGIEIPFPQRTVWMRSDSVVAAQGGASGPEMSSDS